MQSNTRCDADHDSAALDSCVLRQGRTAVESRAAVISGFPKVPPWFRRLFPYSRWGAELNAKVGMLCMPRRITCKNSQSKAAGC